MPEEGLDRDDLLTIYGVKLEEYRFQVNLNWSRTQYFLVLNAAIISVATGLLNTSLLMSGFLFVIGAAAATLSACATFRQHEYYRAIRGEKNVVEDRLGLGDLALRTTPGMRADAGIETAEGRPTWRRLAEELGSVTNITYALLALMFVANGAGLVLTIVRGA